MSSSEHHGREAAIPSAEQLSRGAPKGSSEGLERPRDVSSVSRVGALVACAIGVSVLTGWATGIEALTQIHPRFIAMLPNTAVGMLAGGIAILAMQEPSPTRRTVMLARGLSALVLLLGVLSVASRIAGRDIAFVGILFYDRVAEHPYRPVGVMATNSGIAFTLSGVALLMIGSARAGLRRIARVISAVAGSIVLVALLGHLYGAPALFALDRAAGMALITALAFGAIQIGILFLHPDDDDVALVTAPDLAGSVTRRLLPLSLAYPIALGMVWLVGREQDLLTRETGVALFVAFTMVWLIAVSLYNARFIRHSDAARAALLEREQQARAAAETASKAKSDFLAVMSHELRTPLNAIVGYAEILAHGTAGPVTGAQVKHLERIGDSARHLTRLVDEILTLTRPVPAVDEIPLVRVSLPELLDEIRGIIEPLALGKGLHFECLCDDDLVVESDPHRLRQILINLGGNAVKFTTTGSVRIHARRNGDDEVFVDVIDTGVGIAPEHTDRIFDDFWQAENPLTRSYGGSGLGLAVSRRLARMIGGEITVESRPLQGSRFTLKIGPLAPPEPVEHMVSKRSGSLDSTAESVDRPTSVA